MRQTWFSPERWAETLYVPPLRSRVLLRTAQAWERVGAGFSLPGAGVHIVEATKQLYRPGTVRAARRRTRLVPVLAPSPARASRVTAGDPRA
jgi:hypothetical protein